MNMLMKVKKEVVMAKKEVKKNKAKIVINWKKIWEEYDKWFEEKGNFPSWEKQQRQLEKMVNEELRRLK